MTNKEMNLDPQQFDPNRIAIPCGLLAKYFPKDEFIDLIEKINHVSDTGSQQIRSGLSYPVTIDNVHDPSYKEIFNLSSYDKSWIKATNPLFINWMVS